MATEKKDSTNKNQLALASIMFFSPLVKYIIKKDNLELNEEEKNFLKWYIQFWYFSIAFLIITIALWVSNYIFDQDLLYSWYSVSLIILIIILLIGTIGALTNSKIITNTHTEQVNQDYEIRENSKNIIFSYLPLYNIFIWYQIHEFNKPNILIKESIISRTIFILLCFTSNVFLISLFLILIITRITSLCTGIDFISNRTKRLINNLFYKNPEEIRWYITWTISFLLNKIFRWSKEKIIYFINMQKEKYSPIYNVKEIWRIRIEYIIWLLLLIFYLYSQNLYINSLTYIALAVIFARYIIMIFYRKHLPSLPVIRDILWIFYLRKSNKAQWE